MAHLGIRFNCSDYAAWKQVFDDFAPQRRAAGEIDYQIYHVEGERNHIVMIQEWNSLDNLRAFLASDTLREAMEKSGAGEPTIFLMNAGDSGKP